MRKLKTLTMIALMGVFAYGQQGGGTIPFVSSLDLTYGSGSSMLTTVADAEYVAGFEELIGFIATGMFDANDSCTVAAKLAGDWTKPTDYPSDGNKISITANSDFHLKIVGIEAGDEVAYESPFASATYVELTNADQVFIRALDDGGVQTADFTGDVKIDLAYSKDPVGVYEVTLTLTIAQQ